MTPIKPHIRYRYESVIDHIYVNGYTVIGETPCYWIMISPYGTEKRCSKKGHYCSLTKEEALDDFIYRKRVQMDRLQYDLDKIKAVLTKAYRMASHTPARIGYRAEEA